MKLNGVYGVEDCVLCGRSFRFDARKILVLHILGRRCLTCRDCLTVANQRRAQLGEPLLPLEAYESET